MLILQSLKLSGYLIGFLIIACIIKSSIVNITQEFHQQEEQISTTIVTYNYKIQEEKTSITYNEGPELYAVESELQSLEGEEDGEMELMGWGDEEIETEMEDLNNN
jgi:hypothetical protein